MKKKFILTVTIILLALSTVTSFADNKVNIVVNGKPLVTDTDAVIVNERTMVPFSAIFQALGVDEKYIKWDQETRTVTTTKDGKKLELTIGSYIMRDNNESFTMDVTPMIINSRTMVPIRFVSEHMGAKVQWNNAQRTAYITSMQSDPGLDEILGEDFQEQLDKQIEKQEKERIGNILKQEEEQRKKEEQKRQEEKNRQEEQKRQEQTKEDMTQLKNLQQDTTPAINKIEGYYAIQDSLKNKYVGAFKADGKITATNLRDKKLITGTYKIKNQDISVSAMDLGGSYTISENMYNGWKIIVLNSNSKEKSLVLTPITLQVYNKYSR